MGKTQVHVQVDERRKADWQDFAGKGNLSNVIRRAMSEYMADGESTGSGGVSESVESDIAQTRSTTESIESELKALSSRFDVIENELQDKREVRTIANQIYAELPSYVQAQENPGRGSVERLAGLMSETPGMIREACEQLLRDSYDVHKAEPTDENSIDEAIYYRESRP